MAFSQKETAMKRLQAEMPLLLLNRANSSESTLGPQANWLLLTLKLVSRSPGLIPLLPKFPAPCEYQCLTLATLLGRPAGEVQSHFPAPSRKKLPHILSGHV